MFSSYNNPDAANFSFNEAQLTGSGMGWGDEGEENLNLFVAQFGRAEPCVGGATEFCLLVDEKDIGLNRVFQLIA